MAVLFNFFNLVRALFPRWNFFDEVGYQFHLEYKTETQKNWTLVEFKSQRTKLSFIYNPSHNLEMAQINVIEHFARDVQTIEKNRIEGADTYKMICAIVQIKARPEEIFQFRLQAKKQSSVLDLYCSPILKVIS